MTSVEGATVVTVCVVGTLLVVVVETPVAATVHLTDTPSVVSDSGEILI